MASTFRANEQGMRDLLVSAGIKRQMKLIADKVMARCVETAPVGLTDLDAGEYQRSFRTDVVIEPTLHGQYGSVPRAVGKVINDSDHAVFVEFGNGTIGETGRGTGQFIMNNALDVINET